MDLNVEGAVVSSFTVEGNTGGSIDEVMRGKSVPDESATVVPRSKVSLSTGDSVVYRYVVLIGNVVSVPWSITALVTVVVLSSFPSLPIAVGS